MLTVWYYGTKHPVSRSVAPFFRHASQSNEFDVGIDTWERVDYPLGMLVGFPSEPERAFFSVAATFSPESTGTIHVRVHPKEPDFRIPWDPQVLSQFQAASGLATNSLDASIDVR